MSEPEKKDEPSPTIAALPESAADNAAATLAAAAAVVTDDEGAKTTSTPSTSTTPAEGTRAGTQKASIAIEQIEKRGMAMIADMKKMFTETKVRDGADHKSVWAMTVETFGMADGGRHRKTDRVAATEAEAVLIMKELMEDAKMKCKKEDEKKKWELPYTPLTEFNATLDDVLVSFCKWASVEVETMASLHSSDAADTDVEDVEDDSKNEAGEDSKKKDDKDDTSTTATAKTEAEFTIDGDESETSDKSDAAAASAAVEKDAASTEVFQESPESGVSAKGKTILNVSKAFRRLETYVKWMHENQRFLVDEPLTAESLNGAANAFGMKMSHDETGRLIWWFDIKSMDIPAIQSKQIPIKDLIRYIVWATHFVLLDKQAQDHGMVFIEELDKVGFWRLMSAFPMEVGVQLDRLTIGVLPIRMKALYIMKSAMWMNVLMGMMKPFMSKKMRQRIIIITKNQDAQDVLNKALGGPAFIPKNCCGLEGTMECDILFGTYFTKKDGNENDGKKDGDEAQSDLI